MALGSGLLWLLASGTVLLLSACSMVTFEQVSPTPVVTPVPLREHGADTFNAAVTSGGLPVFPAAVPLESDNPLALLVSNARQQASRPQLDLRLAIDGYVLPESVSFGEVREFYHRYLVREGWQVATDQHDLRVPGMHADGFAAWVRPNRAFVTVTQLRSVQGTGEVLLVIQHGVPSTP